MNGPDDPSIINNNANDVAFSPPHQIDLDPLIPIDFQHQMQQYIDLPYDEAAEKLFPAQSLYQSKQQLKAMLIFFGGSRGFHISTSGCSFICARGGKHVYRPSTKSKSIHHPNPSSIPRRNSRSHKCGCEFAIHFNQITDSGVKITKAKYNHTNGCTPSPDSLVTVRKKSGYYMRLNKNELRSLYYHLTSSNPVSSKQLRDALERILPSRANVSSQMLWNVRVSARKFRQSLELQEEFESNVIPAFHDIVSKKQISSLDNMIDDVFDPSLIEAQRLFEETLKENIDHSYSRFMIGTYMAKLKSVDPNFKYRVYRSNDGSPTGYVYQTSQMRKDFELYGNFVSVDMMMRQMNNLKWPYFGPVVLDGNNQV